jgi:exopolyphosphatase/guanosine-5'-triphosphate,3'-diphosphate pyrophosphatase
MALATACDTELDHSTHVAELAVQLFDDSQRWHGLDTSCREYLEAGALLANVGLFISHSKHHLHSYYVIRNSERLVGFTDSEVEIIAQVARYHRKSAPKPSHNEFSRLSPDDQNVVRTLAGLLRVAIGLDRTQQGNITKVSLELADDHLRLVAHARPEAPTIDLELYAARERAQLLEAVLDHRIEIVAG